MTMTAWENRAKHMHLCIVCHHTFHLLVSTVIGIQLLHHLHSELYVMHTQFAMISFTMLHSSSMEMLLFILENRPIHSHQRVLCPLIDFLQSHLPISFGKCELSCRL